MNRDAFHTGRTGAEAHAYAQQKRAEKRAAAEQIGVDARFIDRLVEDFYAKIRDDALLGPIFARHIADWPPHLSRMKAFWRSVLHNSGEFSGNPMLKHLATRPKAIGKLPKLASAFARAQSTIAELIARVASAPS